MNRDIQHVQWSCSGCGQPIRVDRRAAGAKVRCPSCQRVDTAPEESISPVAVLDCHFCGATLTDVERRTFFDAESEFQGRATQSSATREELGDLARIVPAELYGAYPMCQACHTSTVRNQEELAEERALMERYRNGCVMTAAVAILVSIVFTIATLLVQSRTRSEPQPPGPKTSRGFPHCPPTLMWHA